MPAAAEPHPLADLPVSRRIDCTLAILSSLRITPPGGWSQEELAELCGCSRAAIYARQREACAQLRRRFESLGLTALDLRKPAPETDTP